MTVVDVPIELQTHGRRSVGFALEEAAHPRVRLVGWDLVTPFGALRETWDALLSGRFLCDHTRCEIAGAGRRPRATELAHRASASLVGAGLTSDAAVVVGTSKGTVDSWLSSERRHAAAPLAPEGLADVAASLAASYACRGPRLTVSAACASGLHALVRGAMMVRSGEVRQALVVAAEASVHPLFLGSFQRLGVLAPPGFGCRPFDRNRAGFVMSEAAAAVLLEADEGSESPRPAGRGTLPDAPATFLDRFALGADATHLTGSDPDARILRHLLARVVDNSPVDLFHAHGTGTPTNDETELAAIESVVANQPTPPALYSHKGALGHTLGAAGLLSMVLNCQVHATGIVPPNVQTPDPLPTRNVLLSNVPVKRPVRRSVAVAAGFGGAMAAVSMTTAA